MPWPTGAKRAPIAIVHPERPESLPSRHPRGIASQFRSNSTHRPQKGIRALLSPNVGSRFAAPCELYLTSPRLPARALQPPPQGRSSSKPLPFFSTRKRKRKGNGALPREEEIVELKAALRQPGCNLTTIPRVFPTSSRPATPEGTTSTVFDEKIHARRPKAPGILSPSPTVGRQGRP